MIDYLIREGAAWVVAQNAALWSRGTVLGPELQEFYASWFERATLARVRLVVVPEIGNPPFYADLKTRGIAPPLDFR